MESEHTEQECGRLTLQKLQITNLQMVTHRLHACLPLKTHTTVGSA